MSRGEGGYRIERWSTGGVPLVRSNVAEVLPPLAPLFGPAAFARLLVDGGAIVALATDFDP